MPVIVYMNKTINNRGVPKDSELGTAVIGRSDQRREEFDLVIPKNCSAQCFREDRVDPARSLVFLQKFRGDARGKQSPSHKDRDPKNERPAREDPAAVSRRWVFEI